MSFARTHLDETKRIIDALDVAAIDRMAEMLAALRTRGGRLFFLGVGGSAGNCSHAVNDFRKIAGIEAYAPTDNVSELTARTNDEGWETVFVEWLKISRLKADDALFVFSVGGGNLEKNVSPNLVRALQYAKKRRRKGSRRRRARRRLHGKGRRRGLHHPDRQSGRGHAAFGGVPGRDLAPAGDPSGPQGEADEVGRCRRRRRASHDARRVPRPRRRAQRGDRARRQAVFAGHRGGDGDCSPTPQRRSSDCVGRASGS